MDLLQAMTMNPNQEEGRAAYYNAACAHVSLGNDKEAADCLRTAINDFRLKFSVILKDPDMRAFREKRIFDDLATEVRGGAGGQVQQSKLRAEALHGHPRRPAPGHDQRESPPNQRPRE